MSLAARSNYSFCWEVDGLVLAEDLACGDAEEQSVADLACGAGDGDGDGGFHGRVGKIGRIGRISRIGRICFSLHAGHDLFGDGLDEFFGFGVG